MRRRLASSSAALCSSAPPRPLRRLSRGLSGGAATHAKKVIIDTDPGCDDAMAFVCAIHSRADSGLKAVGGGAVAPLDVIGLTSIFGNVHIELATANSLRLVELVGRPDIPVAKGADRPLMAKLGPPAVIVQGADGFGDVNSPAPAGQPIQGKSAAEFIAETCAASPGGGLPWAAVPFC